MRDEFEGRSIWARMRRKLARRGSDPGDTEDALHTAYLRLLRYRATRPVENPEAFMIRAATNIIIDASRRRRFQSNRPVEEIFAQSADPGPLQDEVIETSNRLRLVERGLQQMSARTREIFLMHRLDGLKYREIAERLDISQSAVEKHVAKAMLFLVRWMRDQ